MVGIDSIYAKTPGGGGEARTGLMNTHAESVIRNDYARGNGKYVVLAGEAHNNTHEGKDKGVPGLSQLLAVPAMRANNGGTLSLDREDTGKRTGTG